MRLSKIISSIALVVLFGFISQVAVNAAQAIAPSQTLLPNGQYLHSGGSESTQMTGNLSLFDAATQQTTLLTLKLLTARAGHSATVLPDGRILVFGGVGQDGYPLASAEIIDLAGNTVHRIVNPGLIARSQHRATVLTDGKVLITGGVDANKQPIGTAELWNPKTQQPESLRASLLTARSNHIAQLLANSPVLISGGQDASGKTVTADELFDAQGQRFDAANGARLDTQAAPAVAEIVPPAGGFDIDTDSWIVVRFNKPLKVETLNISTVTLLGPNGLVPVKVVPTEGGMLLFVMPDQTLDPGSNFNLFISGATDQNGLTLPFFASGFSTARLAGADAQTSGGVAAGNITFDPVNTNPPITGNTGAVGDAYAAASVNDKANESIASTDEAVEEWIPAEKNYKGYWKSGRAHLAKKYPPKRIETLRAFMRYEMRMDGRNREKDIEAKLPKLTQAAAAPGVTAITGQVLRLNGKPLAGVTLSVGALSTISDDNGEFLLTNIPKGQVQVLSIDGGTANSASHQYGRYDFQMRLKEGKVNAMQAPIWLTKLDTKNAIKIPSPTTQEVVVTNPKLPGFELRIPAGTVIRDVKGNIVTEITVTPVPADQLPFPMAFGDLPIYYTLQPGGAVLQSVIGQHKGATLHYPNYSTQPHGARFQLFSYEPTGRGWYTYAIAKVSADGKRIEADKNISVFQFTASSGVSGGATPPTKGPANCDNAECACPSGGTAGDPVGCHDGLFIERQIDINLRDVTPLVLARTYRNEDANQRAFGVGAKHAYDMSLNFINLGGRNTDSIEVILPNGGRVPFYTTGPTTDFVVYPFESKQPGQFYKAQVVYDDVTQSGFFLNFKDGTRFGFSHSKSSLMWMEDRYGNRTAVTRDSGNKITRLTSPSGRYIEFEYNSATCSSCITKATDYAGRYVSYEYDSSGRLTKVTNLEGRLTEYTYDTTTHRMLSVKDPRNTAGEVIQPKVTNEYYSSADGTNLDGRVKKQTYADLTTNTFNYAFDSNGKTTQTEVTHERGDVRRIEYNTDGFITRETYALGLPEQQVRTNTWDTATKLLTSTTDALGRVTAYQYDDKGNVTKLTRMQGTAEEASWTFTYEPVYNQVATTTDPLARTVQFTYDPLGNLTEILNQGNNTKTNMSYTPAGQIETQTAYAGAKELVTRYTYDYGDLIAVTDPLGRTTEFFTDSLGRVAAVTDPLNNISFIDYDALDRVRFQTNALGHVTEYQYDANGNLKLLKDPRQNATAYTYDARNRVTSMTDPLGKGETYIYDEAGNLKQLTDRKGQVSGHTYDYLNRRTQTGYGATSANPTAYTRTVTTTYDAGNRPTLISDSQNGVIDPEYDGHDRLKSETGPNGRIDYSYHANGLRHTQTVLGQPTITYGYDNGNRPTQITQGSSTVSFGFDEANRRTSLTLPNGVLIRYTLDDASQITRIDYSKGPSVIGDLTYAYDAAGRRIQMGGSLAKANLPANMSATYDAANRLTLFNARSLSYDNNGNLLNDGVRSYTWDGADRLASISGGATASFQYDALNRRQSKTVNGTQTGFLYDGINPVQELSGATPKANLLTGGVDEFFTRTSSGGTHSFITDALGSTLALADSAGNLATQYTYEAYGKTSSSGAASDNPFQYTGRENDGTGLYYYRARYYDPELSRFISQDPIGFEGGINWYAYVGGNPLRWTDPLGLKGGDPEPGLQSVCFECVFIPAIRLPAIISNLFKPQPPSLSPGLPPPGVKPPVKNPESCKVGPSTRGNGQSIWDENGGEWRYKPEDSWHNPHWDYNPWNSWNSPWQNVPVGGKPPVKL